MPSSSTEKVLSIEYIEDGYNTVNTNGLQTEAELFERNYLEFTFSFDFFQNQNNQKKVKPSQTKNYAFETRNRIQRERFVSGEYSVNELSSVDPFLPTTQLARETSVVQEEIANSSEGNQPILQIDYGDPLFDSETLISSGLAHLIADTHNQTLLNNLENSRFYNQAVTLVHNDLACKLNNALDNKSISDINANNCIPSIGDISNVTDESIEVHVNNVEVLNKLSKYTKILETAEKISEKDYKVFFTGEQNQDDLNTFTNTPVYNTASTLRKKIKTNLEKQNKNPLSFTVALSSEDFLSKVQETRPEDEVLSDLRTTVLDITKNPGSEKALIENIVGSTEELLNPLTYQSKIEGDHWLRKNLRAALKQRLLDTKSTNDQAQVPVPAHDFKEKVNFAEPVDINYSHGLDNYLQTLEERVHNKISECPSADLYHMPAKEYNKAYSTCHKVKIKELNQRYPTLTSREKFMVYHAELASLSDQDNLNSLLENKLSTPLYLEDRYDGKILRNTVVGQNIQKNLNLSADLARKVAGERGAFIKTLAEFCSPDCANVLENIQDRHESFVKLRFNEIKEFTHELSPEDEKRLLQPESLTHKLFKKHLESGSKFSSVKEMPQDLVDDVLYKHAEFIGLTDVGNRLPEPLRVLTLK